MNYSPLELLTYDVISDLLANGHMEDAYILKRLLIQAQKGGSSAMIDMSALAAASWLSELRMETVAAENWRRKLEHLQAGWQDAAQKMV